jgi:SAM-dependent methyltransferase
VNEQALLFDRLAAGGTLYEYGPDAIAKIDRLVQGKRRLLDVGCGDGTIGGAIHASSVIGIDISPRCAKLARRRGVRALVADAGRGLPFPDGYFDTVYCIDVLHHLGPDWQPILRELVRVLAPGGALAIVEPDARNPFVRWTQAPNSPIRVAPYNNEPAIDPVNLIAIVEKLGLDYDCFPIHIEGEQVVRSVFPLWQRLAKAPFTIALARWYRRLPNKFAIVARKPDSQGP